MTTKAKAKADEEQAAEPASTDEAESQVPRCGTPHFLPALTHITCQLDAQDPDRAPGSPDHQHRHQDGDTIYVW